MNEEREKEMDFEEVYSKYYNIVYKYILSMCKKESVAEDITQEAFYKALKNIDKYDEKYKMVVWLCQIAKNTYFTYYNKQKKRQALTEEELISKDDFISVLIDNEKNIELHKILHSLEEPYKEVFTLRTFGELSFKNIGEVFSKSENWARVTYYRSKVKIKEKYDE